MNEWEQCISEWADRNMKVQQQLADAQATVEALQQERDAIEKALDINSGKTTLEKVTALKYSFAQVWSSYQNAANELFTAQTKGYLLEMLNHLLTTL